MHSQLSRAACLLIAAAALVTAGSAEGGSAVGDHAPPVVRAVSGIHRFNPYRLFPNAYRADAAIAEETAMPASYDVPDEAAAKAQDSFLTGPGSRVPILANTDILAFYGSPNSKRMGVLGWYPKEKLANLMSGYAQLFDAANGDRDVITAFHLIYGTCWPEGNIGYLSASTVEEYVKYAEDNGMLVFLDHQIGKYTVEESVRRMLPFLRYPNVHLGLDPEWRTLAPMQEIGSISSDEINRAEELIQGYLQEHDLPGVRMLIIHQFTEKMIQGRPAVRADFDRVIPVHVMDGFGNPSLKRNSYALNARAANLPLKGFKLFFKSGYPGAGYDDPLMTPAEVLSLQPAPVFVMYQ
jgi:hypothetical protein